MPRRIATWNPDRDCWETDQLDLLSGHSDVFSGIWPASGMTVAGTAYELPTSVPRMDGSGCSLLPTPMTQPDTGNGHARNLGKEVRLLPTPTVSDSNGPGAHGDGGGPDLRTAVSSLPRPAGTARDTTSAETPPA